MITDDQNIRRAVAHQSHPRHAFCASCHTVWGQWLTLTKLVLFFFFFFETLTKLVLLPSARRHGTSEPSTTGLLLFCFVFTRYW